MAIYVSNDKTISFYQGDSGNITFTGIPTDKSYTVYFAISNPDTNEIIGEELTMNSANKSSITFTLTAEYTDSIPLSEGSSCAVYRYGLKICSGSMEYTLIPEVKTDKGDPEFQSAPKVVVYPKYSEGAL